MTELFCVTENWMSLITLSALEIILGLDNLIFITLTTRSLPLHLQTLGWRLGLGFACIARLFLLSIANTLSKFRDPIFHIASYPFSGRDLILISGGVFLLVKGLYELFSPNASLASKSDPLNTLKNSKKLWIVIFQIVLLDLVFSLDSVITAIAMAQHFIIMATSIILSIGLMLLASKAISQWIQTYPSIKNLGLGFLCLIGLVLIFDGFGHHISRSYIYTAIGFAAFIELIHWVSRDLKTKQ